MLCLGRWLCQAISCKILPKSVFPDAFSPTSIGHGNWMQNNRTEFSLQKFTYTDIMTRFYHNTPPEISLSAFIAAALSFNLFDTVVKLNFFVD